MKGRGRIKVITVSIFGLTRTILIRSFVTHLFYLILRILTTLVQRTIATILKLKRVYKMGYFSELDIELRGNFYAKHGRELPETIETHRPPTPAEIKRGYGAIRYKTMPAIIFLKLNGTLKKWTVCPIDGLRYYRG